jgi:hypothetical protein
VARQDSERESRCSRRGLKAAAVKATPSRDEGSVGYTSSEGSPGDSLAGDSSLSAQASARASLQGTAGSEAGSGPGSRSLGSDGLSDSDSDSDETAHRRKRTKIGLPAPVAAAGIVDANSAFKGCGYYSMTLAGVLLEREEEHVQPAATYASVQVEISLNDHAELVDWMAEVVYTQEMQIDVLFLAVHILDLVLRLKPMKRKSFQLLGATCLFLASKLEEVKVCTTPDPPQS